MRFAFPNPSSAALRAAVLVSGVPMNRKLGSKPNFSRPGLHRCAALGDLLAIANSLETLSKSRPKWRQSYYLACEQESRYMYSLSASQKHIALRCPRTASVVKKVMISSLLSQCFLKLQPNTW